MRTPERLFLVGFDTAFKSGMRRRSAREENYFFFFLRDFFLGAAFLAAAFFRFLATVRPPKKVFGKIRLGDLQVTISCERVPP